MRAIGNGFQHRCGVAVPKVRQKHLLLHRQIRDHTGGRAVPRLAGFPVVSRRDEQRTDAPSAEAFPGSLSRLLVADDADLHVLGL